ncbi:hypothetical protein [Clostridium tyrobutyricum]|uniref:hypothetical protein n=1 Tax=Clostridium tyrobutyricum TaxID=1519 RepID=UPI00189FE458|nr:hypothetical protein [Clostridium tyrobutyricum]MBV4440443.1 hypothetical protein [Clostridium tyrobutyricum]
MEINGEKLCMVALLFDSGKIDNCLYGEYIFEKIISGKEVSKNGYKIVVSSGDIFSNEIYDDIRPFIIRDELCSIEKEKTSYKNIIYGVLLEDISFKTAKEIDTRIKDEVPAYIGMTSIDYNSKDPRKQFWKSFIRQYSIENQMIVYFGYEEEGCIFESNAKEYGFRVNYDNFPDDLDCEGKQYLFSTRQSSYIKEVSQLNIEDGKSDSDRGRLEMNYALVKEVEIAGVQIWKAIEDINRSHIIKNSKRLVIDYIFTSLYQAAQGIERLLKISIELLIYGEEKYDKEKVNKLLYGHSHSAMVDYLTNEKRLELKAREKYLVELLSKFYNSARYHRYSYSEDDLLEIKLIREFAKDVKDKNYDDAVKHMYGKSIGRISRALYTMISQLSREHGIFVYELNSDSVATFVFFSGYQEDLYSILKQIEQSKRELLWFLIRKGGELPLKEVGKEYEELPFDDMRLQDYLQELVCNENSGEKIYEFVSDEYDEMVAEDKEKWKKRLEFIEVIGNTNIIFGEEDE